MRSEMEQPNQNNFMRKDDPRYIEATIKHSPTLKDPLERQIIDVIKREAVSTPWAEDMVARLKESISSNWRDAVSHIKQPEYVRDITQKEIIEAAEIMNSHIISGQEYVEKLGKKSPVMIVSNHLATFKLVAMNQEEMHKNGIGKPLLDIYYPYVGFLAPFRPVAKILENDIYEAAVEAPTELGELFKATGNIGLPPKIVDGRADILTDSIHELTTEHPSTAFVIFPEGGTTGKRSGGKIYDLEKFYTGSFVIASNLDIPILPVIQYFNPNSGFELGVLEPFVPEKEKPKEYYEGIAESTRGKMQTWLDQRRQSAENLPTI